MRIHTLKILSKFRGLPQEFSLHINTAAQDSYPELIQPVCLVGRNGSGKSNIMEFLSEVFYYLDYLCLSRDSAENIAQMKYFEALCFELEYEFWQNGANKAILSLSKQIGKAPIWEVNGEAKGQITGTTRKEQLDELIQFLPKRLLGYSSGQNELLSNPYMRMRFHYYQDYLDNLKQGIYSSDSLRLFYMNYETNALVLLANYLLRAETPEQAFLPIQENVQLKDVQSFRIVIERNHKILPNEEEVGEKNEYPADPQLINLDSVADVQALDEPLSQYEAEVGEKNKYPADSQLINLDSVANVQALDEPLSQYIDCLQQCATTYHSEKKQKIRVFEKIVEGEIKEYTCKYTVDVLQLDYYVTPATKQAFAHFFGDAKSLFEVFYQLNMLNIHALSDKQIREVQSSDRDFDIVAYLPKKAQDELIFGIEEIKILKTDNSIVDYRGLSDGEHQFLHIMGTVLLMNEPNTLFILDEPETHFNPQWRSKLVSTFNQIAQVQQEQRNQQMFVLTTHSPFVVSDCRTENVFKFEKGDLSAKTLEINTYGSPFETLLYEAFEKEESISEMANAELKKWHKELKTLLDGTQSEECKMIEIDKLKSKIIQHSDSIERNMLLEYLNRQRKFLLSPQKSINHAPIFSDNS